MEAARRAWATTREHGVAAPMADGARAAVAKARRIRAGASRDVELVVVGRADRAAVKAAAKAAPAREASGAPAVV